MLDLLIGILAHSSHIHTQTTISDANADKAHRLEYDGRSCEIYDSRRIRSIYAEVG